MWYNNIYQYINPKASNIFHSKAITEAILCKSRMRQGFQTRAWLLKSVLQEWASAFKLKNEIRCVNIGKYEANFSLLIDDIIVYLKNSKKSHKNNKRASLVAQWLRICLPMQGTRVRALVWEDPICHGATRPVSHNYWACASGACAPQQERPR